MRIVEGHHKARQDDREIQRATAYELAQLIAFGYHQPSEMPSYKPLGTPEPEPTEQPVSSQADIAYARAWFMARAN